MTSPFPVSAGLNNLDRTDFMNLFSKYVILFTENLILLIYGFPVWFNGAEFFLRPLMKKTDNILANSKHFPMKHVSWKHVVSELKRAP